jgi:succinate-semialdehyde dehydrogenase / glutarate-semialdehyde dehydrogenase
MFDLQYQLLIGGQWQDASSGATFAVTNPFDGSHLTLVADAGAAETRAAIDAAAAAQYAWAGTSASERAMILRQAANLMVAERERLATIMTLEQGKPLSEALGEISYAASFLSWFASEAERVYGMTIPASHPGKRLLALRQPVGVCALITPWNFPAAMITRKLGPALAAGCTVICKPAEQTPLSAIEIARIFQRAGLPAGVFNLVTSSDPIPFSQTVFSDERVRKVSFTGSTEVGKILIRQSAETVKRLSLELGGNAPFHRLCRRRSRSRRCWRDRLQVPQHRPNLCLRQPPLCQRPIYDQFAELFSRRVAQLTSAMACKAASALAP